VTDIPYARQDISDADIAAVVAALREPLLTQGPLAERFEDQFAEVVGARYAVVFNSGTAALHGAYAVAGVGPGRGVLTTPITFAATANAAHYLDAPVRFVDIDPATALIDPSAVARADPTHIHVLAPVHFGGQVADLSALATIAAGRGWMIIEDGAHALGATYRTPDGRTYRVGACAHSTMCCFSFHPVKHITTGEGGLVTTNDAQLAALLRRFRTHGITRDRGQLRHDDGPWYYEQMELGYNYRLTDVQCALGLSQLTRLGEFLRRRREIATQYDTAWTSIPEVRPLAIPPWSEGAYHLYVVRVPPRARRPLYDRLRIAGIHANVHYIPVYRHPYYQSVGYAGFTLPHAEAYYAAALSLPMFPRLSDAEVRRVTDCVAAHFIQSEAAA
jgi:UDP-4-amino-4,6-dideoxy-N-acetyl-beta-L-altrosamine transaminase